LNKFPTAACEVKNLCMANSYFINNIIRLAEEIKSLPHVPMSHPFVERLIGSVRRELWDQTLYWTATGLENKLRDYQSYYNKYQTRSGRDGATPVDSDNGRIAALNDYRWKKHCRGLFQLPVAA